MATFYLITFSFATKNLTTFFLQCFPKHHLQTQQKKSTKNKTRNKHYFWINFLKTIELEIHTYSNKIPLSFGILWHSKTYGNIYIYIRKVHIKMWWWCLQKRTCDFIWNTKGQKILNTKTHNINFDGFPCYNPSKSLQGCEPRRKLGSHVSCSQECRRMWGNEPSHSQANTHFGSWNPNGLLNLQSAIARIKNR